ncbi:hypothetical protein [Haloglomus halophilum]|nr:hypothetical protein [Haloglomus halophilum]
MAVIEISSASVVGSIGTVEIAGGAAVATAGVGGAVVGGAVVLAAVKYS